MKIAGTLVCIAGLVIIVWLLFPAHRHATTPELDIKKVDLDALMNESRRRSPDPGALVVVWRFPDEFWAVSLAREGNSQSDVEKFVRAIRPYIMVVAVDGTMGPTGRVTYRSEQEVRASIRLRDCSRQEYRPLSQDKINETAGELIAVMKPMLAQMLGPMGKNIHFFVFPGTRKDGTRIADARREGSFSVVLNGVEYTWRLPLSSLVTPKVCPKCGERLNGAYRFCPWDGTALPSRAD